MTLNIGNDTKKEESIGQEVVEIFYKKSDSLVRLETEKIYVHGLRVEIC